MHSNPTLMSYCIHYTCHHYDQMYKFKCPFYSKQWQIQIQMQWMSIDNNCFPSCLPEFVHPSSCWSPVQFLLLIQVLQQSAPLIMVLLCLVSSYPHCLFLQLGSDGSGGQFLQLFCGSFCISPAFLCTVWCTQALLLSS